QGSGALHRCFIPSPREWDSALFPGPDKGLEAPDQGYLEDAPDVVCAPPRGQVSARIETARFRGSSQEPSVGVHVSLVRVKTDHASAWAGHLLYKAVLTNEANGFHLAIFVVFLDRFELPWFKVRGIVSLIDCGLKNLWLQAGEDVVR